MEMKTFLKQRDGKRHPGPSHLHSTFEQLAIVLIVDASFSLQGLCICVFVLHIRIVPNCSLDQPNRLKQSSCLQWPKVIAFLLSP